MLTHKRKRNRDAGWFGIEHALSVEKDIKENKKDNLQLYYLALLEIHKLTNTEVADIHNNLVKLIRREQ